MHRSDSLDPRDWPAFRAQAHAMLDDMLDYSEHLRERVVWQPIPSSIRQRFQTALPQKGEPLQHLHHRFLTEIMPYSVGNAHPGFMGWVQGGGTPVGMVAEMLAAGLNANVGGRDQIPVEVEKQILHWMRELFQFPDSANGLFVTGTSIANLIAVLIARTAHLGTSTRQNGIAGHGNNLTAYTSAAAHSCVSQAMDLAGFGTSRLRVIPVNPNHEIDLAVLRETLKADKAAGLTPFLITGSAGTVNVGAVDDLTALADIAETEKCWFHVDGAYGALGMLSPKIAPRLAGIEKASSIAFDFHKWGQVPYDAGYILVRDGAEQLATFSAPADYLKREARGLAAGSVWPCDLGPDLSRGFRALKTWFTLGTFGAEKLGQVIGNTCELALYLKQCIEQEPKLELLAPVNLNIVCFRYVGEVSLKMMTVDEANALNTELVMRLQEAGLVAPSSTLINQQFALRVAIVNHRTERRDMDNLIRSTLQTGDALFADYSSPSTH